MENMRFNALGLRFFLLQAGTSLGMIASHLFRMALAWWCLKETQSVVAFSSLIALSVAAEIYLKPFLAALGDLFHRVKLIIFCQVAVLSVELLFCIASATGYFNLMAVTVSLVIMSILLSVREPTIMGLIPDVVPEGRVTQAISSRTALNAVIMLLGPVLATAIITLSSILMALYLSVAILALSCLAYVILLARSTTLSESHTKNETWLYQTKGAFIIIFRVKSERYIALMCAVINFIMFPFFTITIPYWINTELQLSAVYLGAFECFFALGLVVGSLYLNNRLNALLGRLYNIVLGFILLGSSVMAIGAANNVSLSIALGFFCGAAFIFINVNLSTLRATATPRPYRTRMSAMAAFLSNLANPFGVAITGWTINWMGIIPVTVTSGFAVTLIAPLMLCSLHLRKALSLNEVEMKGYYEKTYPAAFYNEASSDASSRQTIT